MPQGDAIVQPMRTLKQTYNDCRVAFHRGIIQDPVNDPGPFFVACGARLVRNIIKIARRTTDYWVRNRYKNDIIILVSDCRYNIRGKTPGTGGAPYMYDGRTGITEMEATRAVGHEKYDITNITVPYSVTGRFPRNLFTVMVKRVRRKILRGDLGSFL